MPVSPTNSTSPGTSISRRRFMTIAGGAVGAAATGGALALGGGTGDSPLVLPSLPTATMVSTPTPTATAGPTQTAALPTGGRVLVVVQMSGGNDGLNTLVPLNEGLYEAARPSLAIAEADRVELVGNTDYGLHPSLTSLTALWDSGQMAAMQAIGLPEQSRSHFVALDTWWAGASGNASAGGWLGRWMDSAGGDAADPLRAIALGGGSPALLGSTTTPIIVQSLSGFKLEGPSGSDALVNAFGAMALPSADGLLADAQAAIPVAIDAVEELTDAFSATDNGNLYGEESPVALFNAAADIIEADLGTQIILINLRGFDTHANQLATHTNLLGDLGSGISGLFGRLNASGNGDRTLLISYSEFGRRVAQNGSGGTDHGNGGLALLFGPALAGSQVVGDLDLANLDQGDVPRSIDSRSLYANALDWLGGPTSEILGGEWDTYGLLRA